MALYELIYSLPQGTCNETALEGAISSLGYNCKVQLNEAAVSIVIEHDNKGFEYGKAIAAEITEVMPSGYCFMSHRQALAVHELSDKDLEMILAAMLAP